ncbi:MAG: NAD(P)-binding domain-containing protein, partial [Alphaproteobacteria bacterium]|nr:NAD(P)-binding domain-containing protein [Alphaproteobacteria bacterium]
DLIVIGSGVSGLSGGMYAARLGLDVLVLGEMRGGTITLTHIVENYPGFISLTGMELADKIEKHARAYPNVEIKDEKVARIARNADGTFSVESDGGKYESRAVLYATGTEWKKLGAPGEREFANKGVHYCALCDGSFYKGKTVGVIGGSDSAVKDALLLAKNVDAIYSADPKIDPNAVRYNRISYDRVVAENLRAMDLTAITLCKEQKIPIRAFALDQIEQIFEDDTIGTHIVEKE